MSKKVFKDKFLERKNQAQDEANSTIGTVMVHKPKAQKPISPSGFKQSCYSAFKPVAAPNIRLSTGSSSTSTDSSSQPQHSPPHAHSPTLMTEGWEVVSSHGSNSSPRSALTSQLGQLTPQLGQLKIHSPIQHFPSLPKETTIEKVGSDGSREETEVEAARRRQRYNAIASARGDGGSKFGRLAQPNLTHLAPSLSPLHSDMPTTPSEQLQLQLTLSAREEIQPNLRHVHPGPSLSPELQKELNQMRSDGPSIISTLHSQPYRHQQWPQLQPHQNVPASTGTIPRRHEPTQQGLSSLHILQEAQDREMVMASPSRSSPTAAPSTGHSSPPPPQQQKTGAKTPKKRKKAELIPAKFVARGFTKELIVESTIDDFNALLESNPDITDEMKNMFRDWRRKGKNRTAASKSRDRKMDRTEKLRQAVDHLRKQKKILMAKLARRKEELRVKEMKKEMAEKQIKKIYIMRHKQPELFKKMWESLREDYRQHLFLEFRQLGLVLPAA